MSEYLTFQPTNLPVIDKDADIEDIASALRDCWGLGRKPIDNLVYKVESNGLIVIDFDSSSGDVDAFSHKVYTNNRETFWLDTPEINVLQQESILI